MLYFFPTSLFTEWVCVYAYTEPLGQHAGISELFLIMDFMYTFFQCSHYIKITQSTESTVAMDIVL